MNGSSCVTVERTTTIETSMIENDARPYHIDDHWGRSTNADSVRIEIVFVCVVDTHREREREREREHSKRKLWKHTFVTYRLIHRRVVNTHVIITLTIVVVVVALSASVAGIPMKVVLFFDADRILPSATHFCEGCCKDGDVSCVIVIHQSSFETVGHIFQHVTRKNHKLTC